VVPRGYKFEKDLAEANEVAFHLLQVRPTEWLTAWLLLGLFPSLLQAATALRIVVGSFVNRMVAGSSPARGATSSPASFYFKVLVSCL
jgi:hypothetical protein